MSEYGVTGFGQDPQALVAGTTTMLAPTAAVIPGEPVYQLLIPFYPPIVSGGGASPAPTTADGHKLWQRTPARCDLFFYQGDDIVIPLYFSDVSQPDSDMSDQSQWQWFAQVRTRHTYRAPFVNQFITDSSYSAPVPPDQPTGITIVELFLPRTENVYSGVFRWDLYSLSPTDLTRFPKPDDVDAADWPPTDALRTWLYGVCTIVPRVTSTDVLPTDGGFTPQVPWPGPPVNITVLTTGGWCVGPNGKVP